VGVCASYCSVLRVSGVFLVPVKRKLAEQNRNERWWTRQAGRRSRSCIAGPLVALRQSPRRVVLCACRFQRFLLFESWSITCLVDCSVVLLHKRRGWSLQQHKCGSQRPQRHFRQSEHDCGFTTDLIAFCHSILILDEFLLLIVYLRTVYIRAFVYMLRNCPGCLPVLVTDTTRLQSPECITMCSCACRFVSRQDSQLTVLHENLMDRSLSASQIILKFDECRAGTRVDRTT